MTKIYVKSDYIPVGKDYLTAGKIYEGLLFGQGTGFTFTDDNLRSERYGLIKNCAHLNNNDWTIVSEAEYLKQEGKPWYKVGDKVRVVKELYGHQHKIGEVIEVKELYDDGSFYSGEWWLEPEEVEPYMEEDKKEESASFIINTSGTDKLIEKSDRVFIPTTEEPKLTLRDQFAMSATQADIDRHMLEDKEARVTDWKYIYTPEQARYRFADAMLKAREE